MCRQRCLPINSNVHRVMAATKTARKYIELALRAKIKRLRPGYAQVHVDAVVKASMNGLDVEKDVLYDAINLAAKGGEE